MLNLQLASAYVDLSWRKDKYDTDMKVIQQGLTNLARPVIVSLVLRDGGLNAAVQRLRALRQAASTPIAISFSANLTQLNAAASLLRQQMAGMQRRSFGTIPIRADLRAWRAAVRTVTFDLYRIRRFANIPIIADTTAAHANLNLLDQHLRATQGLAHMRVTMPGGRGAGGGGYSGGGFLSGLTMGAGLPYASSPAMMAGQAVGGGARLAIGGSVATAMDLQTEFAELRRLTGANAQAMEAYKKQLFAISTSQAGVSIHDLLDISKTGARAGVSDRSGMGGLAQFTKDLARVKNAITDIPTEELSDRMIRVLNVFELGTDRVAGFGSALTAMDNASTASAADILDITTRLSGTAQAIGLTLPQIVAFSSVLKDVGLSNEVAGSSFSQIFRLMGSKSDEFAQKIGIDARVFADAYRRDPMEALGMVIKRFNEFKDTIEQQEFLSELGLKGVRTAGSLQQLATQFDEVSRRAKIASDETGSLNALTQANNLKSDTAAASVQKLKNAFSELGDAMGSPFLGPMTDAINGLTGLTKAITQGNGQLLARAGILGMTNIFRIPTLGLTDPMPGNTRKQMQGELDQMFYNILYGDKAAEAAKPIPGFGGAGAGAGAPGALGAKPKPKHPLDGILPEGNPLRNLPIEEVWRVAVAAKDFATAAKIFEVMAEQQHDKDVRAQDEQVKAGELAEQRKKDRQAAMAALTPNIPQVNLDHLIKSMPEQQRNYGISSSALEFGRRMQEDILNNSDIPQKQLDEQRKTNEKLDKLIERENAAMPMGAGVLA